MTITLEVGPGPGATARVIVSDEVERREVRSVEDMKRLLTERGTSLTDRQHHGLGLVTALLALVEYGGQYRPDQLGKLLDAIYFPASTPRSGQAFSRGVGEGTFALERAGNLAEAIAALADDAKRDFHNTPATP